ncbi:MerC domain-containing protein [Novosphingobium olei]|uniref:MerC domain-containing protein n=1 Tax=Novosphingobium olei TaxID=2728851 RepID=A0A7Y0BTC4_9SPHN|nr:MerC domain-containing protein [Novosphingobium olei]NML96028.1 MerC domain-containing protein [Novosphingobium olei]BEV02286.1 MerC domain-containing protein [Novosphingobium olei]
MTQALLALRARLDRFGVVLSGLCLIHCLAGLFLVGVLGLGGGVLLDPSIHRIGLILALVVGASTIGLGALRHGHLLPLAVGGTGLALMLGAVLVGHGSAEAVLTIMGVLMVASAHVINMRRGC